ncbi:histone deacetylase family protein [Curvivirga sp.]|uniref:histone deacetylase family protein n=1 Tax=Curvivirga sp. TaxID=2856848 RepID=UPI003B5B9207
MTLLFTHESCILHDMGAGHPEQPARLVSVLKGLEDDEFVSLNRKIAPLATKDQLALMHPEEHIDSILNAVPQDGLISIDGDTSLCPYSGEAAMRAAGAVVAAVDIIVHVKEDQTAFCATRPPGHHAEPNKSMGFCLFNSVAIGAAYAREAYGIKKCAVIDFDVHHGNGTEACFWNDPDFLYLSTHQSPLYPGTGAEGDHGAYNNIVNSPLPAYADGEQIRIAFKEKIMPALENYDPDLLFISAGFDAHRDDPLANMMLEDEDYAWMTAELVAFARDISNCPIISTLEGGYDLDALRRSVQAHVRELQAY